MKYKTLFAVYFLCISAFAGDEREYFWFKNEVQCADARVVVRSYCEESQATEYMIHSNNMCTEQELTIERPGKRKVRRNLQEHQGEEFLLVKSFTCVKGGGTPYLYFGLSNGGNCDTCESDAILDLSGRWKRAGNRWFANKGEKRTILQAMNAWRKIESVRLRNTVRDSEGN
jgi:hypothetical protein